MTSRRTGGSYLTFTSTGSVRPNKYKYYRRCDELLPEYNHIVAVVLFSKQLDEEGQYIADNYVTNVWAVYIYSRG